MNIQALLQWFDQLAPQSWAYQNLLGIDRWDSSWVPSRTGWTDVGTPTVTARTRIIGRLCEAQVKVVPATSIATTAGTSYIALPVTAAGLSGIGVMTNLTTNVAVGVCHVDVANSRVYVPTQAASGNTFTIFVSYEI